MEFVKVLLALRTMINVAREQHARSPPLSVAIDPDHPAREKDVRLLGTAEQGLPV